MKRTLTLSIALLALLVLGGCSYEVEISNDKEVNQLCLTSISGGGAQYWDLTNVLKDCRKGEILTTKVILLEEQTISKIADYEHRLNYLTSKICDFDKQIIILEVSNKYSKGDKPLKAYDLTCVYSGGFEFMNQKWMEEMEEDNESND